MKKVRFWTGFFEILSFLVLISMIVFFALSYEALPAHLPRGDGEALLGARISICLLFAVGFAVYGLLFALKRFPRLMSYPVRITPENMDYQARIGKLMLSILTFCCMSMIFTILYDIYHGAIRQADGHIWLLAGLLGASVADVAIYTAIAKLKEKHT